MNTTPAAIAEDRENAPNEDKAGLGKTETSLMDNEQYRLQMAGISTAAFGYWKEGDPVHPDYDTVALRDVAQLYAKYLALFRASQA